MKNLIVLVLVSIMTMGLFANSKSDKLAKEYQIETNDFIKTLNIKRITFEGKTGMFIPDNVNIYDSYDILTALIGDYFFKQHLLKAKDQRIRELEYIDIRNFRLKTGLGVSISINVSALALAVGSGFLVYALSQQN